MDEPKIGLALSGGGYRATLFCLGSLWRFNDAGLLRQLDTITSVSGGAITAGYLALRWDDLDFEEIGNKSVATNFQAVIAKPLIRFTQNNIDIPSAIKGMILPTSSVGDQLLKQYESLLFGDTRLDSILNERAPQFVFYATNYDTGVSVRISKECLRDWRIGKVVNHGLTVAQAVCISSSFPPFFAPIVVKNEDWVWENTKYSDLHDIEQLKRKLYLCDGGLYDNLGLEMLWKTGSDREYDTVFSCDAGAPFSAPVKQSGGLWGKFLKGIGWRKNWGSQFRRMTDIMIYQQRALRKRWLMKNLMSDDSYNGAYWGIDVDIGKYPVDSALVRYTPTFQKLQKLGTQLRPFSETDTENLIHWGYALADAALRGYYDKGLPQGTLPEL